jgi:hypothetical protein
MASVNYCLLLPDFRRRTASVRHLARCRRAEHAARSLTAAAPPQHRWPLLVVALTPPSEPERDAALRLARLNVSWWRLRGMGTRVRSTPKADVESSIGICREGSEAAMRNCNKSLTTA